MEIINRTNLSQGQVRYCNSAKMVLESILSLLKSDEFMLLPTINFTKEYRDRVDHWIAENCSDTKSRQYTFRTKKLYFSRSVRMLEEDGFIQTLPAKEVSENLKYHNLRVVRLDGQSDFWSDPPGNIAKTEVEDFVNQMRFDGYIIKYDESDPLLMINGIEVEECEDIEVTEAMIAEIEGEIGKEVIVGLCKDDEEKLNEDVTKLASDEKEEIDDVVNLIKRHEQQFDDEFLSAYIDKKGDTDGITDNERDDSLEHTTSTEEKNKKDNDLIENIEFENPVYLDEQNVAEIYFGPSGTEEKEPPTKPNNTILPELPTEEEVDYTDRTILESCLSAAHHAKDARKAIYELPVIIKELFIEALEEKYEKRIAELTESEKKLQLEVHQNKNKLTEMVFLVDALKKEVAELKNKLLVRCKDKEEIEKKLKKGDKKFRYK